MSDPVEPRAQRYADEHTTPFGGATAAAADWTTANTRWPGMMAGLAEARLLQALIVVGGARRVLEIGTFTGVGALSMAAATGPDGRVITLEVDEERAATARHHFDASPYADRIELIVGDALSTLARLDGPFDLVWIDAWKSDYVQYWEAVTPKLAERGVVVADNLFRDGLAFSDGARDAGTVGIREFADRVHADERFDNVLLTIGDGVMLAWRRPAVG
jgi:predicted O-methyltransferase YrrM